LSGQAEESSFPPELIAKTAIQQRWKLNAIARACMVDHHTIPLQREWHPSAEEWNAFCAAADQIVRDVGNGFPRLQQRYRVRDYASVAEYIRDHAVPIDFLFDIARELEAVFPDAPLSMEVVTDPEEGTGQLLISAATDSPLEEALDRLRQFDEAWWLDNVHRAHGQVCVDIGIQ
jgi:hypothetical protein